MSHDVVVVSRNMYDSHSAFLIKFSAFPTVCWLRSRSTNETHRSASTWYPLGASLYLQPSINDREFLFEGLWESVFWGLCIWSLDLDPGTTWLFFDNFWISRTMDDATCANPLLLGWIKEWLDQARDRNSKGITVLVFCYSLLGPLLTPRYRYKKAYDSMKACPLTFSHPSEARQLHGLGEKLCDRLTAKMKTHCEENGLPMPKRARKGMSALVCIKLDEH